MQLEFRHRSPTPWWILDELVSTTKLRQLIINAGDHNKNSRWYREPGRDSMVPSGNYYNSYWKLNTACAASWVHSAWPIHTAWLDHANADLATALMKSLTTDTTQWFLCTMGLDCTDHAVAYLRNNNGFRLRTASQELNTLFKLARNFD